MSERRPIELSPADGRSSVVIGNQSSKTVILSPNDISADWLTSVLQQRIQSVEIILAKALPTSTVYRIAIECENAAAPRTLFLKLCKPGLGGAGKEVEFYNHLAPGIGCPPLIKCYDAVCVDGHSHILLEDLFETHSQSKQGTPPSIELSRSAVEALAKVHRSCWISPTVLGSDARHNSVLHEARRTFDDKWLATFVEELNESVLEFFTVARLTSTQTEAYRRMLASANAIWGRLLRRDHVTATHGDMHWWNFLFPKEVSGSVRVFDWHLWHIDLGARDLAFLLALGGFAEPRPEIEDGLLLVYHEALAIPEYSWEMLIEDYRWSAIRNLNIPVIYWTQGKHYSTWQDALRRAFDAYERLGCGKLLI